MENLLTYILQVNLLLALVFLGYQFLLKNLTFYILNRVYFIIGTLYALVYPLIDFKGWLVRDTAVGLPVLLDYISLEYVEQLSKTYSLYDILLLGIVMGSIIFVAKLFMQLASLLRIHFYSQKAMWQDYLFRNVLFPIVPFSFFNKIYIHKDQHKDAELNEIFEHETVHVKGLHTWDVLLFEILLVGCWYNPFVWLMRKAIRQNLEFLTDQQVLNKGVDRQTYQYSLLNVTQRGAAVDISNQFNFKTLKRRIMMMNKKRSSKLELSKYAFLLPVMLLAGASFTVSQAESKIENVVDLTKETPVLTMTIAKPTERIDTTVNQTQEYPLLAPDFDKELVAKMSNYYEIDGKLVSLDEFLAFPRTEISGVDIYKDKDEIYKKIGRLNADALFVMTSKRGANFTVKSNLKSENSRLNFSSNDSTKNPLKLSGKVITFKGDFSIDGMQPLFIVDNKEMENGFEMKWLNPNDIESITVLKDESAEAVYGDKGKSGVILVQTKSTKAKDEKVVVVTGERMESSQPKEVSVVSYKGKGETMAIQSKPVAKGTGEVFVSSQKPTSGIMRIEATPSDEKVVRIGPKKSYSEMSVDERPLVVIDNVVQGSDFDFKTLNPDDIESISILKDKSTEAVYGDKGKNGVILLQTKSIKEKDLTTTVQESKNK